MSKNHKGYILRIRESRTFKGIAVCLALNLLTEIVQPTVTFALTEGPSQPEVQSFEPIGTTQMVDLFTGDFNYNIPLFNLPGPNGGYPVNLAYHAGVSMDDEASWVGLGWNINAGALVRNMRGLPDEFLSDFINDREAAANSDHLEVKSDIKSSWTLGATLGNSVEIIGAPAFSMERSLYYNNYRGLGVSVGTSIGIGKNKNFSLGISMDTESGLGLSASLDHSSHKGTVNNKHKLSVDFNGDLAVNYSLSRRSPESVEKLLPNGDTKNRAPIRTYGIGFSFANTSFNPSIGNKMTTYNISGALSYGVEAAPVYAKKNIGVFFNTEDYKDLDKNGRRVLVSGYDRNGDAPIADYYTGDFSRPNDGQITPETVILANSHYTYDTYSSTGQGLAGYFRPRRNDIGKSYDPFIKNYSWGFNISFEIGGGQIVKGGIDGGANSGWSTNGPWDDNKNDLDLYYNSTQADGIYENVYYQAHGEQTIMLDSDISYLGGLELAKTKFVDENNDNLAPGKRKMDTNVSFDSDGHPSGHRFVRNTLIHTLTNKEVDHLGEFDIRFYESRPTNYLFSDPVADLTRDLRAGVNIEDHKAGFKVLNEEGSYYVYALPAYNTKEVENVFTVEPPSASIPDNFEFTTMPMAGTEVDYKINGTHKFINKTTTSPYAHSFLLTSVLGADYVDKNNDGPSNDDLGYWVKFDYTKYTSNYRWRAPYINDHAQYHRNATYHSDDDKGSYQYGEKELWYMARIETKTHIAIFETDGDRVDNKEANGEYPLQSVATPDHGAVLRKIKIYEKSSFGPTSVPLQTVHFEYSYELCDGAPNSAEGKLTLKKIYFTSLGSTRGELNKYEFDYSGVNLQGINPKYATNSFDGWGNYKPKKQDLELPFPLVDADFNSHFPYTTQFFQNWNPALISSYSGGETAQTMNDEFSSAWCLNQIKLPSGGTIKIEYESDDYGYVQHKTAAQMFKIAKLNDYTSDDELYSGGGNLDFYDQSVGTDEERRRIYFKLEEPIIATSQDARANEIYQKYVFPLIQDENGQRNLYFKSRMRLTSDVWDYVSGYLPIENNTISSSSTYNFGVDASETLGFVTIKAAKKKDGNYFDNYHPMAVAAWTYLQTDAQELLNNPNSFSSDDANSDNFLGKVVDIMNVMPTLASSFGAIRSYCKSKDMARYIDLSKSCIRLASPDKKKFGGGHRVKEISITDNWNSDTGGQENSRTYGQHYDYTIVEKNYLNNLVTISSGVAQYEPQAGGDENALKYPIYFYGKNSTFTQNNLFSEAPTNEALFPGASVGYRKVTVKSINTNTQIKNDENSLNPVGRTGGVTVHEFYTAKEFPTMVEHTVLTEYNDTKDVFKLPIILPFVGSIHRQFFHGTQGFLIETNDMHGKPKSVKTYELNSYKVNPSPITESIYEYQSDEVWYQNEMVSKLNNYVDVIPNNNLHEADGLQRLMGVEVDLFTDQRKSKTFSTSINLDFNADVSAPAIPIPSVWPSFSNNKSLFKTFVTNKVVHRSGILKRTKTRDLQTVNESEVLAYDEKSGIPLLTKIKNEFGDDFYSYNIPAFYHYDRMGHAYRNINYTFTLDDNGSGAGVNIVTKFPDGAENVIIESAASQGMIDHLVRGDELLIIENESVPLNNPNNQYKKGYFLGWSYNGGQVKAKIQLLNVFGATETELKFKIIRSGRRNHHSTMAANYLTKGELSTLKSASQVAVDPGDPQITTWELSEGVLSATASLFKDDWATSTSSEPGLILATENPFLTGNSGIWRPFKSYTYVGKRKSSQPMDLNVGTMDPNLREDGVFDDVVPMFTWELGDIENYIPNWEWVNEVTRFSQDAYELENVNRLGIHSSALYGYNNSLTIAVGGNASMHELGVCDFETSSTGFNTLISQTNMNFEASHVAGSLVRTEQYTITEANSLTSNVLEIKTNIPYNYYTSIAQFNQGNTLFDNVGLALTSRKNGGLPINEGYYLNGKIDPTSATDDGGFVKFNVKPFIENPSEPNNMLQVNGKYYGKITLLLERPYNAGPDASVTYDDLKAHTGKMSMKVALPSTFDQPKLKLIKDKKYVLSMWISRDDKNVITYKDPANPSMISVGMMDAGVFTSFTPDKMTFSKIVEGWQKVDIELSINQDNPIFAVKFNPGQEAIYVDDIRFSPKTGGITTYVYDPVTFWLKASLNVDNYATLFFYDEEGNLTLKKQETEKGIFTITESRGHVSEF